LSRIKLAKNGLKCNIKNQERQSISYLKRQNLKAKEQLT